MKIGINSAGDVSLEGVHTAPCPRCGRPTFALGNVFSLDTSWPHLDTGLDECQEEE